MATLTKVSVNGQVYDLGGSGGGSSMIEITYAELKSLVDSASLVPGTKYRITDYTAVFKTIKSAGHYFDIVVQALSESELSEKCSAMQHEGDEYFNKCKLDCWTVYYSIENDTTRFLEASTSGKGFIYRIIDEYNNDVCFDFKNALFTLSAEECSFIPSSTSLDFYLFSHVKDFTSQSSIEDLSTISPSNVRNNFVSFNLIDANFNLLLGSEKSMLDFMGKKPEIYNNKIFYKQVIAFCDTGNNGLSSCTFHGIFTGKCKLRIDNSEFYGDLTIDSTNGTYANLSNSKISGISTLKMSTEGNDVVIKGLDFSANLEISVPIKGTEIVIVSPNTSSRNLILSNETLGGKDLKGKLVWAKNTKEDASYTFKVIDPIELV